MTRACPTLGPPSRAPLLLQACTAHRPPSQFPLALRGAEGGQQAEDASFQQLYYIHRETPPDKLKLSYGAGGVGHAGWKEATTVH